VRYRIDGQLVERDRIPLRMRNPLIARLKLMSSIDLVEKRLPQSGSFKLQVDRRILDLDVSTLPTNHGESVVIHVRQPGDALRAREAANGDDLHAMLDRQSPTAGSDGAIRSATNSFRNGRSSSHALSRKSES